MAGDEERLDIVIFGATGFTGMHCIPYVHKLTKENGRNLTWGISGRSKEKLNQVLVKMSDKANIDFSNTPINLADIKDEESLLKLCRKTKILINCCGPYRFYGEPVVKACIEAGTHYVDVSGEPAFLETVQLNYHKAAKEKGIYLVSACGLDSIPCDLGLIHFENQFDGTLNSVVTYIEAWEEGGTTPGPSINYGTWESLVYGLAYAKDLKALRRSLFPERLPSFKPKLQPIRYPHQSPFENGWVLPFPGADKSVMNRTQRYLYENENKRPTQVDTGFIVKNFLGVVAIIIGFLVWALLVKFKFGRSLLLNYPHIFTGGTFRKDQNPSEEKISKTVFQITFSGEGWKEKLADKNDQFPNPPNRTFVAKVKGKNPGYGSTCACVVGAAIMIATEQEKLPKGGGVFTPGAAFGKTSLVELLKENEISFDIISQKDI